MSWEYKPVQTVKQCKIMCEKLFKCEHVTCNRNTEKGSVGRWDGLCVGDVLTAGKEIVMVC